MSGKVLGSAFRDVVQSLMGAELLLPELRQRVEGISDDEWAPWDEYVEACNALADLLEDQTVTRIGEQVMASARPLLERQGFPTANAALADWRAVFLSNVRDLPEASIPTTVLVTEHEAVIDYPLELPPPLIEGFLRGVALAYGHRVEGFEAVRHQGASGLRLRCRLAFR